MLSEKLMEALERLQGSICLDSEKKSAFTVNFAMSSCCDDRCTGGCSGCGYNCDFGCWTSPND